jgi:hypothetical protein
VNVLIVLDRREEAEDLLDRFLQDPSALLAWPRVLLGFRQKGDSMEIRQRLKKAQQANGFVAGLLLGTQPALRPEGLSPVAGGQAEAAFCFLLSQEAWERTPGALDWLRARVAPPLPAKNGKSRHPKKVRRRR